MSICPLPPKRKSPRHCRKKRASEDRSATTGQLLDAGPRRETFPPTGMPVSEDRAIQSFMRGVLSEDALQLADPGPERAAPRQQREVAA